MKTVSTNIIAGCKRSDRRSQQQLYDHCYDDMIRLCMLYAFDAGDAGALYNAGMLKVFTNIKQCKDDTALMAWTRRIIVNTCLDHCRQKLKFTIYPEAVESVDAFIEPGVYDKISAAETLELLKQIPVNAAVVFNLFVIEGYKHAEIAQLLGIPEGTSKWQLNEARKLLKQKLETMHKNKKLFPC